MEFDGETGRGKGNRETPSLDYWNAVADRKTFTHPFRADLLERYVDREAEVLDIGCGYGRVTAQLVAAGWRRAIGIDQAAAMIARGRAEHPDLDLRVAPGACLPFAEGSFDAVLLFSVLTCIPRDADLAALEGEIRRVLRPRGVLYASDLLLQEDERNRARYEDGQRRFGTYGTFELPEDEGRAKVRLRHFTPEQLAELFASFRELHFERRDVVTMNGHHALGFQLVAQR